MSSDWLEETEELIQGHTMMFVCLAGALIDTGLLTREEMVERLQVTADFARSQMGDGVAEPIEGAADLITEFTGIFSNTKSAMEFTTTATALQRMLARRQGRDGDGEDEDEGGAV